MTDLVPAMVMVYYWALTSQRILEAKTKGRFGGYWWKSWWIGEKNVPTTAGRSVELMVVLSAELALMVHWVDYLPILEPFTLCPKL